MPYKERNIAEENKDLTEDVEGDNVAQIKAETDNIANIRDYQQRTSNPRKKYESSQRLSEENADKSFKEAIHLRVNALRAQRNNFQKQIEEARIKAQQQDQMGIKELCKPNRHPGEGRDLKIINEILK